MTTQTAFAQTTPATCDTCASPIRGSALVTACMRCGDAVRTHLGCPNHHQVAMGAGGRPTFVTVCAACKSVKAVA